MTANETIALVRKCAESVGVDGDLAQAISLIESNHNPLAIRVEPNWKWFVTPEKFAFMAQITPITERMLQSCSFGSMQIMGGVLRELGFAGPLTDAIATPSIAITGSCKKLKTLVEKYPNSLPHAVDAYNAGSAVRTIQGKFVNQGYVDRVTAELNRIKGLASL